MFVQSLPSARLSERMERFMCRLEAALLVPRHRPHLEGCSAETAGSSPPGKERARQAQESKALDNCMIPKKGWKIEETGFEIFQRSRLELENN